jgi:hypothetical protein
MNHRVSNAWGPASDSPESAVDAVAVAVPWDDAGGGGAGFAGLDCGGGGAAPGVADVIGGGGGGGRLGGCPVSMARHGVTAAKVATVVATRKVPPLRTARGCSPI